MAKIMNVLPVESPLDRLDYVRIPGKVGLSYSKLLTLHSCPRKFQFKELSEQGERIPGIEASWGHLFAGGVQLLWQTASIERAVVGMAAHWPFCEESCDTRTKRSLQTATYALQIFYNRYYEELSAEWEFIPEGVELFFLINITDKYFYQGHIDLILRNRNTNELAVWEIKTTTYNTTPESWQNSDQTAGYTIILHKLAQKLGCSVAKHAHYLILDPSKILEPEDSNGFRFFQLTRGSRECATFLRNMFCDIQTLQLYSQEQHYPMRGTQCRNFGRVCDFFGTCNMKSALSLLTSAATRNHYHEKPLEEVDVIVEVDELLQFMSETS